MADQQQTTLPEGWRFATASERRWPDRPTVWAVQLIGGASGGGRVVSEGKTTDAVTALIRLRASIVRLAHEVEGMADSGRIAVVRREAPILANRLRDVAMAPAMIEASKR